MDTPPHRLGLERVVEVYSGHDDLVGVTGSGYAIGADLVLTSGLVVAPGLPCRVRAADSGHWAEAEQVWRGRGGAGAVLLRVAGAPWAGVPGIEHVRWARVAASSGASAGFRVRCVARGFPWLGRRAGFRDAETVTGLVDAPTGAVSKVLTVSVLSPGPESPPGAPPGSPRESPPAAPPVALPGSPPGALPGSPPGALVAEPAGALTRGLAGAVLLAEPTGQIIGVVAAGPPGVASHRLDAVPGTAPHHLDAVPATALLGDERFCELAGVAPGRLETVAEDDPSVILAGLLTPARERLPQDCSDWTLLMARHAVVPFLGRDEQLADLRAWAAEPAALSIAVLTGRSGTGKTRLAGELCVELAETGWDTGFLPLDSAGGPLTSRALEALRPTLLVVDHPDPSPPLVGELVRRLAKHGRNPRVRLLLLARELGEADWWRRLDTAAGGWLRRLTSTTVQLNAHPLTLAERTDHALAAMKAFAPSRAALPAPPRLDDPEYGLPLHVHLAALLRLCDDERPTPARDGEPPAHARDADLRTQPMRPHGGGLLHRFLARESDQWARVWPAEHERVDDVTARQAVAVLTLTASAPAELPGLLTAVPGLRGGTGLHGHTANAARWLTTVFPSGELGPDLVAEELLAETESLDELVLALHDHEGRTVHHLVHLLHVLRLSADRARVGSALRSLVGARIGAMVTEAAANPATRLGDLLNAALTLFPADRDLAEAASGLLGSGRGAVLGLRALHVTLGELAVRHRRAGGDRIALAAGLTWLSGRLVAVGRAGEAVVAAAEAVEIYAAAPPYEAAAGRAEALFSLGSCLLLAGEAGSALKPAQEAATRFRILAEEDPGYAAEAARAHHNVACALLELGRLEEAVAAFEAAGGDPDAAAHLAALASASPRPSVTPQPGPSSFTTWPGPEPTTQPGLRPEPSQRGLGPEPSHPGVRPESSQRAVRPEPTQPGARPEPAFPPPPGAGFQPGDTPPMRLLAAPTVAPPPGTRGVPIVTPPSGALPVPPVTPPHGTLPILPVTPPHGTLPIPTVAPSHGTRGVPTVAPPHGALAVPAVAPPAGTAVPVPGPLVPFEEEAAEGGALPELAACLAVAATTAVKGVAPTNADLAHHLHLLAAWLEGQGRPADAVVPASEAVVRLRGLAAQEPGLRSMLADAAGLLAGLHARLDDLDAAARSAAEAVRNLRALVALEPDEHGHALIGQLLELGELLLVDDRPEAALAPLQEAMSVAADRRPATEARARRLLGLCLDELGRSADGRAQLELAAELYDGLSPEDLTAEDGSPAQHASEARARAGRPEPVAGRVDGQPWRPEPEAGRMGGRPWLLELVTSRSEEAVVSAERRLVECRRAAEAGGTPEIHAYISAQAVLARAWTDAGRAGDGLVLATQAAELLRRHPVPDAPQREPGPERPHAIAVGMVAAALGRALVGLGRAEEARPHLRTAIESYEPMAETSVVFRTELAELLILETAALPRAGAQAAADRLVELYDGLVSEGLAATSALAGALCLQGGARFAGQDVEGAFQSATRALDVVTPADDRVLTAACLELAGLCLAELDEPGAAGPKLSEGVELMTDPPPPELVGVHLRALARLARMRVEEEGPAAGVALYRRMLDTRPLPGTDVLGTVIEEVSSFPGDPAELLASLASFTDALEREVPLSSGGGVELHDRYGRCLTRLGATAKEGAAKEGAAREGAAPEGRAREGAAVVCAELAVRVQRGPAAFSGEHRGRLGLALAALARVSGQAEPAVLEQAVHLLAGQPGGALADVLNRYAVLLLEQGRPVEALAHCERAADLCDELDDPAVAAVTYARLGAALAMLDRPQAALEAITWSLAELDRAQEAELDRAPEAGPELRRVRAQAVQVRGQALRACGREQEASAHLMEALRLYTELSEQREAADTAAVIADDLLAAGRPEEAAEYAGIAAAGQPPGTLKHALATQRLVRCHMMRGELAEADALVEELIPWARRSPDDLTYRAVLADSLAQSSELLPLLGLDEGAEAEARAREAIGIYDELLTTGTNAQALHTSRAGACLTLASALRMRNLAAEAIQPLREAVAALERFGPGSVVERRSGQGNPTQRELLSRAMLMLGDALMEAGRALEAGLVFHRATQVTRDELSRAVAHARLGLCQQELGRDDAADAALRVSAGLLRDLTAHDGVADLLRDVLRGRLKLLEKAGRRDETAAIEEELQRL
ncbi:tetratricopeptide repeat protein [Nonomuraea angiospora]|uniref:tetratricopeptide repeat protein n=1 Tax=Nonomuraea angiospora TaxID=46172 RepID=UPI0029BC3891|nr:tetratricopeptide repeat protein [Nonomuraea angiospora]MDX3103414.1 tetratricopeptide repeat protein [Nonomuraea angiospora]